MVTLDWRKFWNVKFLSYTFPDCNTELIAISLDYLFINGHKCSFINVGKLFFKLIFVFFSSFFSIAVSKGIPPSLSFYKEDRPHISS